MSIINYGDREMDIDDVCQEEVCGMSCVVIDSIVGKLREKGLLTPDIENALEDECYEEVMKYLEMVFNYPEYRNHN